MPQAAATLVIMPSGWGIIGAGVIACADTASDKAKPATVINLIILLLPWPSDHSVLSQRGDGPALVFKPRKPPVLVARRLEIDQGRDAGRTRASVVRAN
jgi:hypothetical protein